MKEILLETAKNHCPPHVSSATYGSKGSRCFQVDHLKRLIDSGIITVDDTFDGDMQLTVDQAMEILEGIRARGSVIRCNEQNAFVVACQMARL